MKQETRILAALERLRMGLDGVADVLGENGILRGMLDAMTSIERDMRRAVLKGGYTDGSLRRM